MNIQDFFSWNLGTTYGSTAIGKAILYLTKGFFSLKNTTWIILHCQKTNHDLENVRYSPQPIYESAIQTDTSLSKKSVSHYSVL